MIDFVEQFGCFLQKSRQASYNTTISYMRDVRKFNEYAYIKGIDSLLQCKSKDIKNYIDYMQKGGKSSATITRTVASLKSFYAFLISEGVVKHNPVSSIKAQKVHKVLPRILTNQEVELLLAQPKCDSLKGYRDKAMLELLYATGARVSELLSLDLSDINLSLGYVSCGKKGSERAVPLYKAAIFAITEYLQNARPLLLVDSDEPALFINLNGNRMTRQGFWKIIKHYREAAEIPAEITPHILRHSFAAHLLESGADVEAIKEMMGHSDVASTRVYTQLIKNNLKDSYLKHHPRA